MTSLRQGTLAFTAALAFALPAVAADRDDSPSEAANNDTFMAGDEVSTSGDINGASVLAGGRIESGARVQGKSVLFGGQIRITGETRDDLYAFAGDIDLVGRVDHDARIAGGRVTIGRPAQILGDLTLAGGDVDIDGKVAGDVKVAGGRVRLDGTVGGDVDVRAGQLTIGPNARIDGRLRYRAKQTPEFDPAAHVSGGIEALPDSWSSGWMRPHISPVGPGWFGLLVIGTIMILASPTLGARLLVHCRERTGTTVGWGFLCLVATPVVFVLCAITIIGLPLAIVVLLGYLLTLLVGYVSGIVALGQWGLARIARTGAALVGWQILAFALALLVVGFLRRIPFLGFYVSLAVVVVGIGALLLEMRRVVRGPQQS
jgi:Polymer-forming cytoskeletal